MGIEELREARFRFLHHLYEVTNGNEHSRVSMWGIGGDLGFERAATELVTQFLKGEGLIEYKTIGGGIAITHYGVVNIADSAAS